MGFAASLMRTTPRQANASGASTLFLVRASRDMKRGKATRGEGRVGDNLYSNSLLALDPETGKLKWYFQFSKHDDHDYDATQVPVMVDQGERHLILQANRNGFFYVIDRANGKLLSSNPF